MDISSHKELPATIVVQYSHHHWIDALFIMVQSHTFIITSGTSFLPSPFQELQNLVPILCFLWVCKITPNSCLNPYSSYSSSPSDGPWAKPYFYLLIILKLSHFSVSPPAPILAELRLTDFSTLSLESLQIFIHNTANKISNTKIRCLIFP